MQFLVIYSWKGESSENDDNNIEIIDKFAIIPVNGSLWIQEVFYAKMLSVFAERGSVYIAIVRKLLVNSK